MQSVLQDWVTGLGLRHQGVLLSGIRGCDSAPKDDASKRFVRAYRSLVLNAFASKPSSFIEPCGFDEAERRFDAFRKNLDHYPHHYVAHLMHCVQIVGYKHPDSSVRSSWAWMYNRLCKGLHVNPETEAQLDARLNADEATFATNAN